MSVDDRLREELGALLDGELPAEREAELRARMERDPALAREFELLRRTVAAVHVLGRETAPPALRERLAVRRTTPIFWPRWGLAAAAVLLVAVGAALLALRGDRTSKPEYEYEATLPETDADDPMDDAEKRAARVEEPAIGALREEKDAPDGAAAVRRAIDGRGRPAGDDMPAEAERLDRGEALRPVEPPADREPAPPAPDVKKLESPARDAADKGGAQPGRAAVARFAREGRLARDQRHEYLAAMASLDAKALGAHVASLPQVRTSTLAPTAPAAPAKEAGLAKEAGPSSEVKGSTSGTRAKQATPKAEPPPVEVRMVDRAEAEALGKLLRAGYVSTAKSAAGRASTSFEVGAAGYLDVVVELTARERDQVRNWLALLDATPRPPGAPAAVIRRRDTAGGAGAGGDLGGKARTEPDAKRERVRVRIRFAD